MGGWLDKDEHLHGTVGNMLQVHTIDKCMDGTKVAVL